MSDYHQRFRERFPTFPEVAPAFVEEFLSFIDRTITEEKSHALIDGFRQGMTQERAALIKKIKEMHWEQTANTNYDKVSHHNLALNKVLTYLRREDNQLPEEQ